MKNNMTNWEEYQKTITALSKEEMKELEILAHITSTCVIRRKELKLTQKELADRVNMTQSAIARFEKGDHMPKLDTLLRIAIALGLTCKFVEVEKDDK